MALIGRVLLDVALPTLFGEVPFAVSVARRLFLVGLVLGCVALKW